MLHGCSPERGFPEEFWKVRVKEREPESVSRYSQEFIAEAAGPRAGMHRKPMDGRRLRSRFSRPKSICLQPHSNYAEISDNPFERRSEKLIFTYPFRIATMHLLRSVIAGLLTICCAHAALAEIHIYCADHNNKKLIKIKEDGTLLWDCPNNNGHDVQLLKNGNVLIVTGEVQEVSPTKEIVWKVGKPTVQNAEAAQRLDNGHTMIADNGTHAVIELDENNKEVWHFDVPNSNDRPHPTMRQVRRLENGNTLICASTLDEVWEVNPQKEIVWRYKVPFPYLATRLANGNTLISSGDGYGSPKGWYLIEVDKDGKTVWKFGGDEAPEDQKLRFPSGFVRMPDGTTYCSEAQGADIKVISPDKKVLRTITSPAMAHPCTLVIVDEK